jgi:hypothetical protein
MEDAGMADVAAISSSDIVAAVCTAMLVCPWVAFVASAVLLALYRHRVTQLMGGDSDAAPEPPAIPQRTLLFAAANATAIEPPDRLLRHALGAPRRAALVQILAGLVTGLVVMALAFAHDGLELLPIRSTVFVLSYAWPGILTAALLGARALREVLLAVLAYFALLASLAALSVLIGSSSSAIYGQLAALWFINCALPTLFAGALVSQRVRAVGPLVFVCAAALVAGMFSGSFLIRAFSQPLSALLGSLGATGWLSLLGVELALTVLVSVPVGATCALALRSAYRGKRLSDDTLTADTIWFVAIFSDFCGTSFSAPLWSLCAMLGSFTTYKLTTYVLRRLFVRRGEPSRRAPRLLYLRAFSKSSTGERSFRVFAKSWRFVGSIVLISGPDFATFTVEPHEILDFISGRLAARFIHDASAVGARSDLIDEQRDPDGRFRISELFCRANAWRATFQFLLANADVVLADVRGLSATTPGIRFEVEQLGVHADRARIVLLTDAATDVGVLARYFPGARPPQWLMLTGSPARDTATVLFSVVRAAFGQYALDTGILTPERFANRKAPSAAH